MKINIFKMFKKNHSIQTDFPMSRFKSLDIKEPIYPLFISLEEKIYLLTRLGLWLSLRTCQRSKG